MAERAFETPQYFAEYVVLPNITRFKASPDSLQEAFNSVMSVDALAGHLFISYRNVGCTTMPNDGQFRKELARENEHYGIIRDAVKSYKHIELDGRSIIKKVDQTRVASRGYGTGIYGVGSYSGEDVAIELNDGSEHHCLSEAISAYEFLCSKLL